MTSVESVLTSWSFWAVVLASSLAAVCASLVDKLRLQHNTLYALSKHYIPSIEHMPMRLSSCRWSSMDSGLFIASSSVTSQVSLFRSKWRDAGRDAGFRIMSCT